MSDILSKVLARGLRREDLDKCMDEYAELNIWQVNDGRTIIRFVHEA